MDLQENPTDELKVVSNESESTHNLESISSNIVSPGQLETELIAEKCGTQPIINASKFFNLSYENPWGEWRSFTQKLGPLLKWKLCNAKPQPPTQEDAEKTLPIKPLTEIKTTLAPPVDSNQVRVTWLGHASVLLQFHCANVLCDPVFSGKIGPIKNALFAYSRYRPPPIENVTDLPPIDAVVISHNHYDHLDLESVQDLNSHFQDKLKWYVPKGLKEWMCSVGVSDENVFELMWWEKAVLTTPSGEELSLTLTPTQHWCTRTGFDKNQSLWGSWAVNTEKVKTWFGGDTGYCPVFKEIGERLGPFHFAAIPIGAYLPREMMRDQHVHPEESVKIHKDIKSQESLGIHWGTFTMGAIEPYLEPKYLMREEAAKLEISEEEFYVIGHGESKVVTAKD